MTIYGLYACETFYGGLHGMNDKCFGEYDSIESANCDAFTMSYDVIESYGLEEEYEDDCCDEYTDYYVVEISNDCPYSLEELNKMAYDYFDDLIQKYGINSN